MANFVCILLILAAIGENSGELSQQRQEQNEIANAVNNFGYKLMLNIMEKNSRDNIVISPSTTAGLLATVLLGTVGPSYEEIANSLGFSQDILTNRKNHEQFGDLLQKLSSNSTWAKTKYADAIFMDDGVKLRTIFKEYTSRVYNADVLPVNFKEKFKAMDLINGWVKNKTKRKIETFLKDPLPTDTIIVLLSTLYFSGQWKTPFLPEMTRKKPFMKTRNETVEVDLMVNAGHYEYISSSEHNLHMIAIPYNDSITKMFALKPLTPKETNITELLNNLDFEIIDKLIDQMSIGNVVMSFPKMEINSELKLDEYLKNLGIVSIFDGRANFALMVDGSTNANDTANDVLSRISSGGVETKTVQDIITNLPNPGINVREVIQNVKITIDEFGTEAVAAVRASIGRTAKLFYADSPFLMFIRNEQTKLVTFSAVIFDPTQ